MSNQLPDAQVQAKTSFASKPWGLQAYVTLRNPGPLLAFFIELRLVDPATGQTLLPVLWSDNYVSLPPGASKTLQARLPGAFGVKPQLRLRGWNVKAQTIR
jgi:exo-1,4-beta-D-glucosaminidase